MSVKQPSLLYGHVRRRARGVSAWAGLGLLLVLCFRGVDLAMLWHHLRRVDLPFLLLAIACNASVLVWRTIQWRVFLPTGRCIPFRRLLDVNAAMAVASNSLPFFGGHALGVVLLSRRERMNMPAALSVLAQDQLSAGLSKLALMGLLLLAAPLPAWLERGAYGLMAGALVFFLVMLRLARRPPAGGPGWLGRMVTAVGRWAEMLEGVRSGVRLSQGVSLACLIRAAEAGGLFLTQQAVGLHLLPWWSVLLVLAGVQLAGLVPLSPAGLGVYEAAAFLAYRSLGLPQEQALGTALLSHLAYLASQVGLGWAWLNGQAWRAARTQHSP